MTHHGKRPADASRRPMIDSPRLPNQSAPILRYGRDRTDIAGIIVGVSLLLIAACAFIAGVAMIGGAP